MSAMLQTWIQTDSMQILSGQGIACIGDYGQTESFIVNLFSRTINSFWDEFLTKCIMNNLLYLDGRFKMQYEPRYAFINYLALPTTRATWSMPVSFNYHEKKSEEWKLSTRKIQWTG